MGICKMAAIAMVKVNNTPSLYSSNYTDYIIRSPPTRKLKQCYEPTHMRRYGIPQSADMQLTNQIAQFETGIYQTEK